MNKSLNTSLAGSNYPTSSFGNLPRHSVPSRSPISTRQSQLIPAAKGRSPQIQVTSPEGKPFTPQSDTTLKKTIPIGAAQHHLQHHHHQQHTVDTQPTIILQEQHIIHHTYYPVPVDKNSMEALSDWKDHLTHKDPNPQTTDRDSHKIALLIQNNEALRFENQQLKQRLDNARDDFEELMKSSDEKDRLIRELRGRLQTIPTPQNRDAQFITMANHLEDLTRAYQQFRFMTARDKERESRKMEAEIQRLRDELKKLKSQKNEPLFEDVFEQRQVTSITTSQPNFAQLRSGKRDEEDEPKKELASKQAKQDQDELYALLEKEMANTREKEKQLEQLRRELASAKQQLQQMAQSQQYQQTTTTTTTYQLNENDRLKQENERLQEENQKAIQNQRETMRKLKMLEHESEMTISSLKYKVQMLEQDISKYVTLNDRIKLLEAESEEWRKKFMHLNREYHTTQERLLMTMAELDNIRKRFYPNAQNEGTGTIIETEIRHQQNRIFSSEEYQQN